MLDLSKIRGQLKEMNITPESVGSGTFDRLTEEVRKEGTTREKFVEIINRDPEARVAIKKTIPRGLTVEALRTHHGNFYNRLKY